MDDLQSLFNTILQQPAEDTPRLMYADALDERGAKHDAVRAEFIRKQIELFNLGPPRHLIEDVTMVAHGPDYWEIDVDTEEFRVGDRIDVKGKELHKMSDRGPDDEWHGLLVMRIDEEMEFHFRVVLKRDAESVPYPIKHVKGLSGRCRRILGMFWEDWTPKAASLIPKLTTGPTAELLPFLIRYYLPRDHRGFSSSVSNHVVVDIQYERGFLSAVECSWNYWERHGDSIIKHMPIARTILTTEPASEIFNSDGVVIAGQRIPWAYLKDRDAFDHGHPDKYEPAYCELLSLRWPTILQSGWTLAWISDEPPEDGDPFAPAPDEMTDYGSSSYD